MGQSITSQRIQALWKWATSETNDPRDVADQQWAKDQVRWLIETLASYGARA